MTVTIIGLGLIGGSMAIDIKAKGFAGRIIGVDSNDDHAAAAIARGLVDEVMNLETAVTKSQLVIIAVPVDRTRLLIPEVLDLINGNTVVMDVGSTKAEICATADEHNKRKNFVATHPIAGTENNGPNAAVSGLFEGKLAIICDPEKSGSFALELVRRLYNTIGMNTVNMNSKEHDLHAAYVSHLSHISSFTLGLTVLEIERDEKTIFELAGSGFASTVRLAKSSPEMWSPVFIENSNHLLNALDAYIEKLMLFRKSIKNKDASHLYNLMKEANEIRRVLDGNKLTEVKAVI